MNCTTCEHGDLPRPCRHPEVRPHEGEPPEPTGAAVIEWVADHIRWNDKTQRVQVRRGVRCPGFADKDRETT